MEEHQWVFKELKRILNTEPLLIYPDFRNHFLLLVTPRLKPSELFYHRRVTGKTDLLHTTVGC
jgi:hypothetical protein